MNYPHELFGDAPTVEPGCIDPWGEGEEKISILEYVIPDKRTPKNKCLIHVQRRKLLRHIRKFYHELFKYHNDKLFNKRLVTSSSSVILHSLSQVCSAYIPEEDSQEMAQFLYTFLNIKTKDNVGLKSEAFSQGRRVYECAYKYRKGLYTGLFDLKFFRALFNSFTKLKNLSPSTVVRLGSKLTWERQFFENKSKFEKMIGRFLNNEDQDITISLTEALSLIGSQTHNN